MNPVIVKGINFISRNLPTILTGLGIAGVVTTTVLAVKATPEACDLVNEEANQNEDDLTPTEIVKAGWKPYIPAILSGTATIACIVGAHVSNHKRIAAITTACSLAERSFATYKSKAKQLIGEEGSKKIIQEIAEDNLKTNKQTKENTLISNIPVETESSDLVWCMDTKTGMFFKSSKDIIISAENTINKRLLTDLWVPLNDFYEELGLESIGIGDDIGFDIDAPYALDVIFSAAVDDNPFTNGKPYMVIDYDVTYKWRRYGIS